MFAYCNNNPINYVDITGVSPTSCVLLATNWWNPIGWSAAITLALELVLVVIITVQALELCNNVIVLSDSNSSNSSSSQYSSQSTTSSSSPIPPDDRNNNKPSLKTITKHMLKKAGLDAHDIKYEYLGKKAKVKLYDLAYDTKTGDVYIITKAGELVAKTYYNVWDKFK